MWQRDTSYIVSTKDTIEDVAAKIASTSADAASLARQIAFSDSGLAAASAVRSQTQQFQRVTKDRLDKEFVLLETRDESAITQLTGTRTVHEMRLENISKSVREVEHKSHGDLKLETGDVVSGQS